MQSEARHNASDENLASLAGHHSEPNSPPSIVAGATVLAFLVFLASDPVTDQSTAVVVFLAVFATVVGLAALLRLLVAINGARLQYRHAEAMLATTSAHLGKQRATPEADALHAQVVRAQELTRELAALEETLRQARREQASGA
jgi:hypothetical protein